MGNTAPWGKGGRQERGEEEKPKHVGPTARDKEVGVLGVEEGRRLCCKRIREKEEREAGRTKEGRDRNQVLQVVVLGTGRVRDRRRKEDVYQACRRGDKGGRKEQGREKNPKCRFKYEG